MIVRWTNSTNIKVKNISFKKSADNFKTSKMKNNIAYGRRKQVIRSRTPPVNFSLLATQKTYIRKLELLNGIDNYVI